jgi:glycosyltransferase involved in cell wall biosynthesis
MTETAVQPESIIAPGAGRRRILVSAFGVSPVRGSEPAGGWNLCVNLAAHHDVTVLCTPEVAGENYREEIGQYLRENGPIPGLTFVFVERPRLSRLLQREGHSLLRALYYVGYASWQRAAFARARQLHAQRPFDLVHHLNITGYREPGYLWKMDRRVPFVWGPVGGASNMPWRYLSLMRTMDAAYYALRNVANAWQMLTAIRPRRAAHAAAHVFVTSEDNRRLVQDRWGHPSVEFLLDGGSAFCGRKIADDSARDSRPLRIAWTGLHIGRKALPILLRALPEVLKTGPAELIVLGDGPLLSRWQTLAKELGVDHVITWAGRLSHEEAVAKVADADVLAFTSLQEGTPFAVLEALSLEVPVICHDGCGMGIAVTDACGIKIPMRSPALSTAGFARALTQLRNTELLQKLSAGAGKRAMELSWQAKATGVSNAYERIWHCHASRDGQCLTTGRMKRDRANIAQSIKTDPSQTQFRDIGMANAVKVR